MDEEAPEPSIASLQADGQQGERPGSQQDELQAANRGDVQVDEPATQPSPLPPDITAIYDQLDPSDPRGSLGIALLARLAYFVPTEQVPRDMLLATFDRPAEDSGVAYEPGDVLAQLIELGLIEGSAGVVYLRNDLARHLQDRP